MLVVGDAVLFLNRDTANPIIILYEQNLSFDMFCSCVALAGKRSSEKKFITAIFIVISIFMSFAFQ